ncbi:MAG: hypothetical protein NZM31_04635, partial [Gemmatales bacterium]|nr:hypothetical protein [Gemmatales bacterium]MDW8386288.1 hypothetical protein [Gemmatales bacterium]
MNPRLHVPRAALTSRLETDPETNDIVGHRFKTKPRAALEIPQSVSDADVRFAVERFLRNNPRFRDVTAEVKAGTVYLRG